MVKWLAVAMLASSVGCAGTIARITAMCEDTGLIPPVACDVAGVLDAMHGDARKIGEAGGIFEPEENE